MLGSMNPARVLVYDGGCGVCVASINSLRAVGLGRLFDIRPFQDFDDDTARRLLDAGFHNAMAALDRDTGEIRTGIRGLLWLLSGTWLRPLAAVLSFAPILWVLEFLYPVIAANRRVLAPPKPQPIQCLGCDPDPNPVYQWVFMVLVLLLAGGLAFVVGRTVPPLVFDLDRAGGAAFMLIAVGGSWLLLFLFSLRLKGQTRILYLGHLAVTLLVGLLIWLPVTLLACADLTPANVFDVLAGLTLLGSMAWMCRMHARRLAIMGLARGWWLAFLVSFVSYVVAGLLVR